MAWFDPQKIDGELVEVHGNPNVLTIDKGASSLSQGNIVHRAGTDRKMDWVAPEITAHEAPSIERLA